MTQMPYTRKNGRNIMETIIMGRAVVPQELRDTLTVEKNNHARVYSTMHPVQSPYFRTWQEVCNWYNSQDKEVKSKFVKVGHMCIYEHGVDLIGRDKDFDGRVYYTTIAGEVIATDEAYMWDFAEKRWL
jgi:hypothetical protein